MKPTSRRVGITFIFMVVVLFGMAGLVACDPDDRFKLVISVVDENGTPFRKAQVQLILPNNDIPPTELTDDLGTCYFFVEREFLYQPATVRVFWASGTQSHTQTITISDTVKIIQVNAHIFLTEAPTLNILGATSTQPITETLAATLSATATLAQTLTLTPSPIPSITPTASRAHAATILPSATSRFLAFTPYPTSKNIISPNTKNDVWQLATWRTESAVYSLSISSDGKLVASGEQNGRVIVRDISTGTPLYMFDYGSAVLAVAFSPDGQWLAAAGSGRNILAWNTKSWNSPVEIGQHSGKVTSLSFSPDSTLLASSGYEDKAVKLWQVGSWALSQSITVPDKVNAAVFSHDSKWIAVIANDIYPRVWDRYGRLQYELDSNVGPRQSVISVAFSPDSSTLVTGTRDLERCLQVWDTKSQKLKRGIGGNVQIDAIAFSPSGELLVTTNSNKNNQFNITIWRASNISELRTLENYHQDVIHSVVFTPDGKLMLTASRDHTIRVWGIR